MWSHLDPIPVTHCLMWGHYMEGEQDKNRDKTTNTSLWIVWKLMYLGTRQADVSKY